ncbi:hypothetical protein LZZ85_22930 [Terrimonas sp. NA20]|uniref:Uncharacterized protein n=1 Tax=Terrimonas ginsenosidimutans TaxID=2908004 RepID=A0ABS9KY65_9BACT|nr:hypothetical protein [Terrimonas ginsenosidimutans]MCG2617169.1 hypothetical protein [Terrimonas ginsenosidimutans]
MIAHIQFRHRGQDIKSLLVFNFGAVKDVIVVVPQNAEVSAECASTDEGNEIIFTRTAGDVWVCPKAGINQFPDTFAALRSAMEVYFNQRKFSFKRRSEAYA